MAVKNNSKPRATCPEARIRYKRRGVGNTKYPMQRLPFWVKGGGIDLPTCSNYHAGCALGTAAAQAYLKALKDSPRNIGGSLQHVVISMLQQKWSADALDPDNHRGVVVGFFSTLDQWLRCATDLVGSNLDSISERDLEDRMNLAARQTPEESEEDIRRLIGRARLPEVR